MCLKWYGERMTVFGEDGNRENWPRLESMWWMGASYKISFSKILIQAILLNSVLRFKKIPSVLQLTNILKKTTSFYLISL